MQHEIKLTHFSHGSGCGCKIAPSVLNKILKSAEPAFTDPRLLVGNDNRDDAAVYAIDDENVIISTTDFFMPIVDDPVDFGMIASVNAISDVYAMGGKPIMAIAILGWPLNKLSPEIANLVLKGARQACKNAGISLAGGHSIDSPEPIFGLAVTGSAKRKSLLTNSGAKKDNHIYLTKPLGVGIMTTAMKAGLLGNQDFKAVRDSMITLNKPGEDLGTLECVTSLTDVTGFGLLGHLIEMCEASNLSAKIDFEMIPQFNGLKSYLDQKTIPGGTSRNYKSYGHKVNQLSEIQKTILCDPQTSGGLLIAVDHENNEAFLDLLKRFNLNLQPIGKITEKKELAVYVE
ncbi:MAG: selenide, water dikinase SelD [Calditrichaeota bacterium]|nr:MAG: selenide, water dikinase SelD [Calditrichota bacterium]MBL1203840.1 selenide, water dikinase SelD [Calditrichota bacterium]NOG43672.1 selenide, water dikinase SelD [Calditrichota bacterium]